MKTHVYDTHVKTKNGDYYHFDVLVSDETIKNAGDYAKQYLTSIGIDNAEFSQNSCNFCHSEMANPKVKEAIEKNGFYIIPMQGCPS